jgi:hypothetical protein
MSNADEYSIDLSARWGMSRAKLIAEVAPIELYKRFGYPLVNDGDSESLGTYVFVSKAGNVVTVYYRANDLWSLLVRLLRKRFWRRTRVMRLTISANDKTQAETFGRWLSGVVPCTIGNWPW